MSDFFSDLTHSTPPDAHSGVGGMSKIIAAQSMEDATGMAGIRPLMHPLFAPIPASAPETVPVSLFHISSMVTPAPGQDQPITEAFDMPEGVLSEAFSFDTVPPRFLHTAPPISPPSDAAQASASASSGVHETAFEHLPVQAPAPRNTPPSISAHTTQEGFTEESTEPEAFRKSSALESIVTGQRAPEIPSSPQKTPSLHPSEGFRRDARERVQPGEEESHSGGEKARPYETLKQSTWKDREAQGLFALSAQLPAANSDEFRFKQINQALPAGDRLMEEPIHEQHMILPRALPHLPTYPERSELSDHSDHSSASNIQERPSPHATPHRPGFSSLPSANSPDAGAFSVNTIEQRTQVRQVEGMEQPVLVDIGHTQSRSSLVQVEGMGQRAVVDIGHTRPGDSPVQSVQDFFSRSLQSHALSPLTPSIDGSASPIPMSQRPAQAGLASPSRETLPGEPVPWLMPDTVQKKTGEPPHMEVFPSADTETGSHEGAAWTQHIPAQPGVSLAPVVQEKTPHSTPHQRVAEETTIIRVHIGRLVVRAAPPPPPAPSSRRGPRPALSLKDYLKQRENGTR